MYIDNKWDEYEWINTMWMCVDEYNVDANGWIQCGCVRINTMWMWTIDTMSMWMDKYNADMGDQIQ